MKPFVLITCLFIYFLLQNLCMLLGLTIPMVMYYISIKFQAFGKLNFQAFEKMAEDSLTCTLYFYQPRNREIMYLIAPVRLSVSSGRY